MFIHYVLTHCNDIVYNVIKDKGRSPKKFSYYVHTRVHTGGKPWKLFKSM